MIRISSVLDVGKVGGTGSSKLWQLTAPALFLPETFPRTPRKPAVPLLCRPPGRSATLIWLPGHGPLLTLSSLMEGNYY